MSEALEFLVHLLDLETIEVNVYRGTNPKEERQRTFGGQVAAQALMAAGRTVERGRVHSLHSYFLRPGDPTTPILYEVDRIRDGKSFTTRRVVAIQHGRAIYNMQASFHTDEVSVEHQIAMPDVPGPETIRPARRARPRPSSATSTSGSCATTRSTSATSANCPGARTRSKEPRQQLWIKADGTLPDDPLLHACVVTYASDMSLFDAILKPHAIGWDDGTFMGASLDHCMWFHHDLRADEWLLYDTESPIAYGGRGLARGFLFSRDGELKVSHGPRGSHARASIPPTRTRSPDRRDEGREPHVRARAPDDAQIDPDHDETNLRTATAVIECGRQPDPASATTALLLAERARPAATLVGQRGRLRRLRDDDSPGLTPTAPRVRVGARASALERDVSRTRARHDSSLGAPRRGRRRGSMSRRALGPHDASGPSSTRWRSSQRSAAPTPTSWRAFSDADLPATGAIATSAAATTHRPWTSTSTPATARDHAAQITAAANA